MAFRTVDVYGDRPSQLAVESFLLALLAAPNPDVTTSFLGAFLKRFSLALGSLVRQPTAKRYPIEFSSSLSIQRCKLNRVPC